MNKLNNNSRFDVEEMPAVKPKEEVNGGVQSQQDDMVKKELFDPGAID